MKTTRTFGAMLSLSAVVLLAGSAWGQMNADNYAEDFEGYEVGMTVDNFTNSMWTATETNTVIVSTNYAPHYVGGDYPIDYDHAVNTKVLWVENGVTNTIEPGAVNQTNWVDVVIKPTLYSEGDSPELPPVGSVAAVYFNSSSNLVVMHTPINDSTTNAWLEIPDVKVSPDKWIRLTIAANMADGDFFGGDFTRFYQVYINGTVVSNDAAYPAPTRSGSGGTWFGSGADIVRGASITNVTVKGTGYIDDLVLTNALTLTAATTWTIEASAGANGSIDPSGSVVVSEGNSQAFTITPDSGYAVDDVVVVENGATNNLGSVTGYTFTSVIANGSITASFVEAAPVTWSIEATAGLNGSITPSGSVVVTNGDSQAFTITPDSGYLVDDVVVVENGATNNLGSVTGYTFTSVIANGSITASFIEDTPPTTSNGTPFSWYDQFGIATNETTTYEDLDLLDSDGDGVPNWKEYIAGTDPMNPASVFKILGATVTGGNVQLDWYGGTNGPVEPYIVEGATSLVGTTIGWMNMTNMDARVEGTNTWSGTPGHSMLFFRVLATPDP